MPILTPPSIFLLRRPGPPLDRFVDRLWYWEGDPPAHARDRLMPDGCVSLVINLAEDALRDYEGPQDDIVRNFPGAVLVGARSRYAVIDSREQRAVMAAVFRPGGAWPFFEPAGDELYNQHVAIGDLWRSGGASLRERVISAPTPSQRLLTLESELLARAIRPLERRREIDFALLRLAQPERNQSIAELGSEVGLSTRCLSRLFTLEVGVTPKLYGRIKRFERMLQLIAGGRVVDWGDLAVACGYFDQSHLIRDCKLISGFTPTELRLRRTSDTNHIAIT